MNYPVIPRAFFSGDCFDAYRILGAHPCTDPNGTEGWRFAVWAPGATAVEVCGGFVVCPWKKPIPACGAPLSPALRRGTCTNTACTARTAAP